MGRTANMPALSYGFTLNGPNNQSLTGIVNVSALAADTGTQEPTEDDYDDSGAAYYVCAVILVYGLSIVSLIGSLAKKKLKDKTYEVEEAQIHKYLHQVPDLREKSARDNFRQLKRNVIKLVEETGSPEIAHSSRTSFPFPGSITKTTHAKNGAKNGEKRTPHHGKISKRQQQQQALKSETQHLLGECGADDRVPPDSPSSGHGEYQLRHSMPFERLENCEPEETITLVTDTRDNDVTHSDKPRTNVQPLSELPERLKPPGSGAEATGKGRAQYRWSLGKDGNIWIMQVDEKGEERVATPVKVSSPPPPPSPGYTPTRFSQKFRQRSPCSDLEMSPRHASASCIDPTNSASSGDELSERQSAVDPPLSPYPSTKQRPSSLLLPVLARGRSSPSPHSYRQVSINENTPRRDQLQQPALVGVEAVGVHGRTRVYDLDSRRHITPSPVRTDHDIARNSDSCSSYAETWSDLNQRKHKSVRPNYPTKSKHEIPTEHSAYRDKGRFVGHQIPDSVPNGDSSHAYRPVPSPTVPSRSVTTTDNSSLTSSKQTGESLSARTRYGPRLSPKLASSREGSSSPRSRSSRGGSPRSIDFMRTAGERDFMMTSDEDGDGEDLVHVTCV